MSKKYKQLLKGAIFCSLAFMQMHIASFAVTDTFSTEISDNSKITKIEFEGNHLIKESDILNVMNIKVGDIYTKDSVQETLKEIYQTGYFSDKMKAIPIPTDADSLTLRVYLEENIPITGFAISGNTVVTTGEILNILNKLEQDLKIVKNRKNAQSFVMFDYEDF